MLSSNTPSKSPPTKSHLNQAPPLTLNSNKFAGKIQLTESSPMKNDQLPIAILKEAGMSKIPATTTPFQKYKTNSSF